LEILPLFITKKIGAHFKLSVLEFIIVVDPATTGGFFSTQLLQLETAHPQHFERFLKAFLKVE
jgi:hypothetical protein